VRGGETMIHYRTRFRGKEVFIRDLEQRDVDLLVRYWHESPVPFLKSLGVDLAKLKSPAETRQRLLSFIPNGGGPRSRVYYIVESENQAIAYTNLNLGSGESDEGVAHFHVLIPSLWAKAVCYVLFPEGMRLFFSAAPVARIVFQISPDNLNIARMLEHFNLQGRLVRLEVPDGMARPGLFNVYEIHKEQMPSLARHAAPGGE
jgi:hypothetical protein